MRAQAGRTGVGRPARRNIKEIPVNRKGKYVKKKNR